MAALRKSRSVCVVMKDSWLFPSPNRAHTQQTSVNLKRQADRDTILQ